MKLCELFKKNKEESEVLPCQFYSPVIGLSKSISEAPYSPYKEKLVGDGIYILPSDNKIYAPVDCTVAFIFPSRHALGLRTPEGYELFLHVGFQTDKLRKNCFLLHVTEEQTVTRGQLLCEINLAKVKERASSPAVTLLATNLMETQRLIPQVNRNVTLEDIIFEIR